MVWPAIIAGIGSLFGGMFGGGAAAAGGAAAGAGGATGGGALGGILGGAGSLGGGSGATSALSGIMGESAGPMSMMGGDGPMSALGAGGQPAGVMAQNPMPAAAGADPLAEPTNWDKVLSSIEGDMEKPISQGQMQSWQNASQLNGGIMSGARPQYGMEDFKQMFGTDHQQREQQKVVDSIMHPYVAGLMGG